MSDPDPDDRAGIEPDELDPAAATVAPASWSVMVKRGLRKKCPRCGGGRLFRSWVRMRERCPHCGFKFEREEGFFVGAYFINFAVTEGLLFIGIFAYIFVKNSNPDAGVAVPVAIAAVVAVVAPLVCYPFSRTVWSAVDLSMTPLELDEIIAARDYLHGSEPGGS